MSKNLEIPAGPDLDRLVAERVMGFTDIRKMNGCDWYSATREGRADRVLVGSDSARGFAPSTDIAHAWEVVERMEQRRLELGLWRYLDAYWEAEFVVTEREPSGEAKADTAPLAICLAALKAVGA